MKTACNDNKCRVTLQHKYCNWRIFPSSSSRNVDLRKVKSYRVGNICLPRDRNKGNKVICKTWDIKEEDLVCKCKDEKKRQVLKGKHNFFLMLQLCLDNIWISSFWKLSARSPGKKKLCDLFWQRGGSTLAKRSDSQCRKNTFSNLWFLVQSDSQTNPFNTFNLYKNNERKEVTINSLYLEDWIKWIYSCYITRFQEETLWNFAFKIT